MTLRLTRAIPDGIRRTVTRTGVTVFGLLVVTQLLFLTTVNTAIASAAPAEIVDELGLTLPLSTTAAVGLVAVSIALTAATYVFIARAFARPRTELDTLPSSLYTRRIGRASLWTFLGGIIVFVAVLFGFAFLILPGLFLAACFAFFVFAVGVEDRGVIGALRRSWGLSRGNRLRLVVLVISIGGCSLGVSVVPALFEAARAPALGDLSSALLTSIVSVFAYAIVASAYLQVTETDG